MGYHSHKELIDGKQNIALKSLNMINHDRKEIKEAHGVLHVRMNGDSNKKWRHIDRHFDKNYPKIKNPL